MFSRIFPRASAVALVLALVTTPLLASPVVTATSAGGLPGSTVSTTMRIDPGLPATVDLGSTVAWDLVLNWGSAPIYLDPANSTLKIGSGTPILLSTVPAGLPPDTTVSGGGVADGFYRFSWLDANLGADPLTILDLDDGVLITASFQILANATPGSYEIGFTHGVGPSALTDASLVEFQYASVSAGDPMRVVVERSPTVPEPGTAGLLACGVAALLFLAARRRSGLEMS